MVMLSVSSSVSVNNLCEIMCQVILECSGTLLGFLYKFYYIYICKLS